MRKIESMPQIDIHPLIAQADLQRDVAESLRVNELKPKLLYITPHQTELWRQVFLKHSPIHGNPEFARIYRDTFARISGERKPGKVWLIGLGCGTGLKEAELASRLIADGHNVAFSAIDVSHDLVSESARRLVEQGVKFDRHLVCDLTKIDFLKDWLARINSSVPRIFTLFGLVPNLYPQFITRLLGEILRPGDILLVNAHLAPVEEGVDLAAAMKKVLPQYNNPETVAWLDAALDQWKLKELVEEPRVYWGKMKEIPCFYGASYWRSPALYDQWSVRPRWADPSLILFRSLRYTPELFEKVLSEAGLHTELLAMTARREEAIWSVRHKQS